MAEQEQSGDQSGSLEHKVGEGRSHAARDQHDAAGAFGGGKNGTTPGGLTDTGLNPSDYPSGDSPERLTKAGRDDPQNSRPEAPYTADE